MTQSVFLIGPMGAGKSTIGRLLSQELKYEFFDSDKVIEERCGADIPWIFDKEGEAGFREREESVIDELTQQKGIVLSTGGGAVLRSENRQHLASRGTVIYLCTSVDQQLARTARDRNRRYSRRPTLRQYCASFLRSAIRCIALSPISLLKRISAIQDG